MPFSTSTASLRTLLLGAAMAMPGVALAADPDREPDTDSPAELVATLVGTSHEHVEAADRKTLSRDIAKRLEDRETERSWLPFWHGKPAGREVLFGDDPAPVPPPSFFREHFRFTLKRGVEYRQKFQVREQDLQLKVWGPIVGDNPGLGIALDGLRVEQSRVRIKAYGSTDKSGLQIDVEF
jgi:hypothetical protein